MSNSSLTNSVRFALATASLAQLHSQSALAQEQDKAAASENDSMEEVIVTGSRVRRVDSESASPIITIDQAAIEKTGVTTAGDLLQRLPTVSGAATNPAVNNGGGFGEANVELRGLDAKRTLVLLNGRRLGLVGASDATDINLIPVNLIERVDVLKEGAGAIYGSDAIAGVVNLRLRDARDGGDVSLTYGEYDTTVETERGQRDASDGGTMTASGWVGLPLGEEGFLTLSGEYRDRDPTSRGDFDNRVPGSPVTSRYGDGQMEDITAYVNAGVPFENDWTIYGWAGYQQREGNSAAFPRIFNDARNVPAIYPNGFLPLITSDIDDLALGWGLRGKLGGGDTDISLVYGKNDIHYGVEDSLNTSFGAASQTSFDAGGMTYDQLTFNAGMVRGFDWGLAEPVNLAFGVEYRWETYEIEAGEPASCELPKVYSYQ